MYTHNGPHITSLGAGFVDLDHKFNLVNLSKPIIEITEMTDENAFQTVKLDRESRQYIHVRVRHILKTYDQLGNMTVTNTYYPIN